MFFPQLQKSKCTEITYMFTQYSDSVLIKHIHVQPKTQMRARENLKSNTVQIYS